ncbi:MAG: aldo/keto reductase [Escherichia coli]|nr:MAG: aldo/keto reductase [Escherichia coli]
MSEFKKFVLSNGVEISSFGLGVYKSGENTYNAVKTALELGYRHIDTAAFYGNEDAVGQAVRDSKIPREDIFVTTKLWNDDQRQGTQEQAFESSLKKLDIGYIDLYLVHWPVPEKYVDTWKMMQQFYNTGKVRAIGVSNFMQHHLEDVLALDGVKPMVDQFECHPECARRELREFCKNNGIVAEAWSPLARGAYFDNELLVSLAEKYGKTPAQIILRWDYQGDIVTIPKSVTEKRIKENMDILDFSLTDEEMEQIFAMDKNSMHGDPDNFDF